MHRAAYRVLPSLLSPVIGEAVCNRPQMCHSTRRTALGEPGIVRRRGGSDGGWKSVRGRGWWRLIQRTYGMPPSKRPRGMDDGSPPERHIARLLRDAYRGST